MYIYSVYKAISNIVLPKNLVADEQKPNSIATN